MVMSKHICSFETLKIHVQSLMNFKNKKKSFENEPSEQRGDFL